MQQFPRFQQTHLSNFTVRVGKSIQFSCTVENLGPLYKVTYLLLGPVYEHGIYICETGIPSLTTIPSLSTGSIICIHGALQYVPKMHLTHNARSSFLQVAWLHSEKGTLAVHPAVITQNDRVSVSHDSRATYNLRIADIQGGGHSNAFAQGVPHFQSKCKPTFSEPCIKEGTNTKCQILQIAVNEPLTLRRATRASTSVRSTPVQ